MGAAVNQFEKSQLLLVDRNRFIPVKKTSDLMILDSDIFYKDQNLTPYFKPKQKFSELPKIKLGTAYEAVEDYQKLVLKSVSLQDCKSLEINGKVVFGKRSIKRLCKD